MGIGGDPVNGTGFVDVLPLFEKDPETQAVLMIGEIGGDAEEKAAEYIKKNVKKTCDQLYRRHYCASRTPHGPRWRDYFWWQGYGQ